MHFFLSVEVEWEIAIFGSDEEEEKRECFMFFSSPEDSGLGQDGGGGREGYWRHGDGEEVSSAEGANGNNNKE